MTRASEDFFLKNLGKSLANTNFNPQQYTLLARGKVRDIYERDGKIVFVSTDRQSAFDRHITEIPAKGEVLTSASAFFFGQTADIIQHHLIARPDPRVMICRKATVFPVEFVVRNYLTGSTETSIWKAYQRGDRRFCGHDLPNNLRQHQRLPRTLVTPTTKANKDENIAIADIWERGLMSKEDAEACVEAALAVFARGAQIAAKRGMLLVDTKFEFGRCQQTGELLLVDEILTPDSSRWWRASSYAERMEAGQTPEGFDKEQLRIWYTDRCDPYRDEALPAAPPELRARMAAVYADGYQLLTGAAFAPTLADCLAVEEGVDAFFESA